MQFRNLPEDGQIEIYIDTFDQNQEPIAPSSAFVASDFAIFKNGSATAKATTNGITVTSPFNSEPGTHLLIIDTSNDTGDAGFWTTGSRYQVKFNTTKTVDGKSIDGRCVSRGAFGIESEYMRGTNAAALASGVTVTAIGNNVITAASIAADAAAEIGAATLSALGTGSWATAIPWNTAWDAEVQSECADSITAAGLMLASAYTAPDNASILLIKDRTDNLPSDPADQSLIITATDAVMARLGTPAGASVSADIASVKVDTGNLTSRITSTLFSGITQLSRWLGALAGKTADSTTLTEIQATTAGAGYNNTTDSLEALRDRGDAAWITGSSSGGLTSEQAAALSRIDAKTALITGAKLSVAGAVTPGGDITLVIGDDRVTDADSELLRSITDTGGALHGRLAAASQIRFGAGRNGVADIITGTVTSAYATNVTTLTIQIDQAGISTDAIASEDYTYQIQRVTADGDHVVEVSGNLTLLDRYVSRTT